MNDIEILKDLVEVNKTKIEEYKSTGMYYNKDVERHTIAIENLLKERQTDKDRIKELEHKNRVKIIGKYGDITLDELLSERFIPKSLVREKISKNIKTNEHTILGGRRNGKTLEYGIRLGRIQMCEELLKESDNKKMREIDKQIQNIERNFIIRQNTIEKCCMCNGIATEQGSYGDLYCESCYKKAIHEGE